MKPFSEKYTEAKAKEESECAAEERKGKAKEVFKEECYEKEVQTRKEVRMMYSESIGWV